MTQCPNHSCAFTNTGCVRAVLDGFNYTLLAYGQTGSGKTYSMLGPPDLALAAAGAPCAGSPHGVMPRAIHDLFSELEARNRGGQCADGSSGSGSGNVCACDSLGSTRILCTYLEISNNNIFDLLQPFKPSK